ncbi:peptidase M3 [Marivirga tractuosa]|uniref:Oligopeptidase A n=1 Tax=Marivirga tractuosa (strain ATCC 23168 / DSM 4126 / NBRC 15989 / NCIMB 1408 / VKM B-1430 / H-43) TaxID=643867 RepID=E4TLP4_MARTH|nr:M3 family metallopeptidase [Marivirga tractuosa]ADR22348.1 Oligopeptidase A [Marivirga tractuosa DSM 4126]BDD13186.1 peptidase M3 [Marivirga tractuosa]
MDNPLLKNFDTPFQTPPFDKIESEHFMPAIEEAIKEAKQEIEDITSQSTAPTFENTLEAMEFAGEKLSSVTSILFNLNSAETNKKIQEVAREASPILSEFGNDIWQNADLFERVKAVYNQKEQLQLDNEQEMLLTKTYKAFIRNGADLNEKDKARFKEITKKLSQLSLTFGENVLAETNDYELVISDEKDLSGLPDSAIRQAANTAKAKGKEGKWVFTLQAPSFVPFMENGDNRSLREQLYKAYMSKANKNDERDNKAIIQEIVNLRSEKVSLLGYDSYADYVLEERMAESTNKVQAFLDDLLQQALPKAQEEVAEIKAFVKELGDDSDLQRWDWGYYSEKLKKKKYAIDDELLRPYFKLENVLDGVFQSAEKLYDIRFKEVKNIPVYHEDVTTYEVSTTSGEHVAIFYADFHPREGKRGGAWMTTYRDQYRKNGEDNRPLVSNVCNFTPSSPGNPSLLTFNEVTTLFHEFGHALHAMLGKGRYGSLSGANVYWDFVELPSQIFENWCYEKECLDLFAKHYETGEKIPQEYVEKIKASSTYHEAYATVRQVSLALLDMGYFSLDRKEAQNIKDVAEFEGKAMAPTKLFDKVEGTLMSTQFGHIFSGGYASGYYSYKWAEVLDADAFSLFKEKGIFNKEVAQSFKDNILSKGGSEHPMELYKRFRGREPKIEALLERAGLK